MGAAPQSQGSPNNPAQGKVQDNSRDGAHRGLNAISRFGVGVLGALATAGLASILDIFPLTSRLDPWAVLSLVIGLLFGPIGLLGASIAHFLITISEVFNLDWAAIHTFTYFLMGMIAYAVFRFVPNLKRDLSDLRSYLGFLAATIMGSHVLSLIGSANLFKNAIGTELFWTAVVYWFSSAITSLLIVAPFFLVVALWAFRPWLISMPKEGLTAPKPKFVPGGNQSHAHRMIRKDIAFGLATVLATTAIVSPLVHLQPQFGGWFALLYLVPILWGSINRGLRGGVLVASGSGVAYLLGSAISSMLLVREVTHQEILGQFAGLVIFSMVGAITGAFQQARFSAESDLLQSKIDLERRHESLSLVNRLADRLKRTLDVETIAQESVEALVQLSRPPLVAVYLLDAEGLTLELKAQQGFDGPILNAGRTLPLSGSLSGFAISNRQPLICEDISVDDRIEPSIKKSLAKTGCKSGVFIPLVFEQKALGTINLLFNDFKDVSQEEEASFSTIGRTVALALVNARHVAQLEHLAFHDELTGLPNREGLHRWFSEQDLTQYGEYKKLALVLIDIDRFKEINDALGHHLGDQVLSLLGPRIESAHPEGLAVIFHLTGDEFAVLFPDLHGDARSEDLSERLLRVLEEPFEVSGMALQVEASAGIAIFPDDADDSSALVRCAGVAVNHAKRTKNHIVRYNRLLDQHTPERLALASELGRAIQDGQLALFFQPQVTLVDGKPVGFEALVRWQHPTLGLLPPEKFIPLAEVGELIQPLTYWVVEEALKQLKIWQQRMPKLTMAINLSTRNLIDRSFAKHLVEIMNSVDIDPSTIEFELTETALVVDPEAAAATLWAISDSGARVVIDDFGTGYSSLEFLKRYPIHGLKIDRSFVGDMLNDKPSRAIVRATVQLAHDLGLSVVAEGIENPSTVGALSEMGCLIGQGFYFLHPSSARDAELRLKSQGFDGLC